MTTPKKVTGIRVPIHLDKKLSELAKYKGTTKNNLIVDALWNYLESDPANKLRKHSETRKEDK